MHLKHKYKGKKLKYEGKTVGSKQYIPSENRMYYNKQIWI